MNRLYPLALLSTACAICSTPLLAQSDPSPANSQPQTVKVYKAGGKVSAPEFLPRDYPDMITSGCGNSPYTTIQLSMIVDASGSPRNVALLLPSENADLDKLALKIVASDKFKPGQKDGAPVAVAQSVELKLQGCPIRIADQPGHSVEQMWLSAPPSQEFKPLKNAPSEAVLTSTPAQNGTIEHLGKGVSAPIAINQPVAEYSDEARQLRIQGECMVSLVVDPQGMPQNPRVVRPLGHGLDAQALQAVMKYRFKPAVKNGVPVPVMVTITINFRL